MNVKSTNIRPRYDRVLCKRVEAEKVRGLYVSQAHAAKSLFYLADVVAIGEGRVTENNTVVPLRVAKDDRVMVEAKAGMPLTLEDGEFLLISEMHVLAVVDRTDESRVLVVA